jgi:hypothetical protein
MEDKVKNIRYIRTRIDDKPAKLLLNKCNFCPYFRFDKSDYICKCTKFTNDKNYSSNEIEKKYVFDFYGNITLPFLPIDIPDWCKLADNDTNEDDYFLTVLKDNYMLLKYVCTSVSLDIINDNNITYKDGKLSTKSRSYYNYSNLEICSICGENKDTVKRKENLGVCEKCLEIYKDNESMKYFAYVNNFRLKRKSTFNKNNFKIINKNIVF